MGFRFRAWAGELGRPEKDLTARARFFLRHWSLPSLDLALHSRTSLMRVFELGARSTSTRVSTMSGRYPAVQTKGFYVYFSRIHVRTQEASEQISMAFGGADGVSAQQLHAHS